MSNMKSQGERTIEVMRLLEQIVDGFTDEYRRPTDQIALYEKYVQLRQSYDVKLVRHLIVITGGRPSKAAPANYLAQNARKSRKTNAAGATSGRQLW